MYNHPPNAGSMVLAFISGFSMMVIPAYGTDQYTLSLEGMDGQGQALTTASNHDAVGTWFGIWFIPLMANTPKESVQSRKIAILAANGVDGMAIQQMKKALVAEGAVVEIIAPKLGDIKAEKGAAVKVDKNFLTVSSVLYDAVYIPGGKESIAALTNEADAIYFINQAYKHCKAIAVDGEAEALIAKTSIGFLLNEKKELPGFVYTSKGSDSLASLFIKAIAQHRFWERETMSKVPA